MRVRRRVVVLLALAPLSACADPPEPPPPAEEMVTIWRPVGAWSGRGDRQTESFDVTSGVLRLAWATHGESEAAAGRFRVVLHSSISGRPLQTVVDTVGAGADSVHFADEPRVSYLLIESDQVDWTMSLEEAVSARSVPRSGS